MKVAQRTLAARLARGARELAHEIETGEFPMRQLVRNTLFSEEGTPGCAVGHVLVRAGCKMQFAPFQELTSAGICERWWAGIAALRHVLDRDGGDALTEAVGAVEIANDLENGLRRKREVSRTLRILADVLERGG